MQQIAAANTPIHIENPARVDVLLEDDTVFRAIAAVTEAVSERGTVRFSIFDGIDIQRASRTANFEVSQWLARPRNDVLVAYVPTQRHVSLFAFTRTEDNFDAVHYDSATNAGHRANLGDTVAGVTHTLNRLEWLRVRGQGLRHGTPTSVRGIETAQQMDTTSCGMHAILNAWTIALGLQLSQQNTMTYGRYMTDFRPNAARLINYALEGRVDSGTIEAFLRCYGYINGGAPVPAERTFNRTVALPRTIDLGDRVARVRIQDGLDAYASDYPGLLWYQNLDEILEFLGEDQNRDLGLAGYTVQQFIDLVRHEQTARLESGAAGPIQGTPPPRTGPAREPPSAEQRYRDAIAAGVPEEFIQEARDRARLERDDPDLARALDEAARSGT